jgi:hypothetical protein
VALESTSWSRFQSYPFLHDKIWFLPGIAFLDPSFIFCFHALRIHGLVSRTMLVSMTSCLVLRLGRWKNGETFIGEIYGTGHLFSDILDYLSVMSWSWSKHWNTVEEMETHIAMQFLHSINGTPQTVSYIPFNERGTRSPSTMLFGCTFWGITDNGFAIWATLAGLTTAALAIPQWGECFLILVCLLPSRLILHGAGVRPPYKLYTASSQVITEPLTWMWSSGYFESLRR